MIVVYDDEEHREGVIVLWKSVFNYKSPHNAPEISLSKKLGADDGLLFVAVEERKVIGTVMAGYDGHRGWLYSLAVELGERGRGVGGALMKTAESALAERGCLKVNLQIMPKNQEVTHFYESMGYGVEERINMGKVIG